MDTGPKPVHLHLPWNLILLELAGRGVWAALLLDRWLCPSGSPPLPLSLEPGDPLLSFTLEGCPHLPSITFASCNVWRHWSHRANPLWTEKALGPHRAGGPKKE